MTGGFMDGPTRAGRATNPEVRGRAVDKAAPPTSTLPPVDILSSAGPGSRPWRKQGGRLWKLRAHPVRLSSERPMSALTCPHLL